MSLSCLACHAMDGSTDSFRMDSSFRLHSVSVHSDDGRCGGLSTCWSKKSSPPRRELLNSVSVQTPQPAPPRRADSSVANHCEMQPRLTRCHAVRRDIFSNWTVGEIETENGRQLCFNLAAR